MNKNNDENRNVSFVAILKGSLFVLVGIVIITMALGTITHLGWPGLLNSTQTFYMVMFYLTVVSGSIYAGLCSQNQGWMTGAGVGFLASLLLLIISILSGQPVNLWAFILKGMVNCLVGALGGIIGVNIIKK